MSSDRLAPSKCRRCGANLDAATDVEGAGSPTPGAASICFYCGTIALFADDLTLREPTITELDELLDEPIVARVLTALWDTRLARVVDAVEGVEFACGCHTTAMNGLVTLEACSDTCSAARMVFRMMQSEGKPMAIDSEWRVDQHG